MAGGMGRGDDPFRETLAERVANTRARQAGTIGTTGAGHSTAGFHSTPPRASSAWTAPAAPTPAPARSPAPQAAPHPAPADGTPDEPVRPCWYRAPWGRVPALLLRWRRTSDGTYAGLVVVAAPDETGDDWTAIRLWAPATHLTPM